VGFVGTRTDPEDGSLSGGSLLWTTNRTDLQTGTLGTGGTITVRLYSDTCSGAWSDHDDAGMHAITKQQILGAALLGVVLRMTGRGSSTNGDSAGSGGSGGGTGSGSSRTICHYDRDRVGVDPGGATCDSDCTAESLLGFRPRVPPRLRREWLRHGAL